MYLFVELACRREGGGGRVLLRREAPDHAD